LPLFDSALDEEKVTPDRLRVDSTLTETNIHYPTDSKLLWDSFRALVRLIWKCRESNPGASHPHCRFHDKKMKHLHAFISGNAKSRKNSRNPLFF